MEDSEHNDVPESAVPGSLPIDSSLNDGGSRKKLLIPVAAILIIIIGVLMAIKASVQKETRLNLQPVELAEGAELPNFTMTRLDGTKVQVDDLKNKVSMLNFWATWCEACMEEMPSIVKLHEAYAPKGFEILGLNVDEDPPKAVPPTIQKFGMKFPIFMDPTNALTELFDVHAIPLTVIFDSNRKILLIESGSREWDDDEMHQLLDNWLN
ncbi:MAG: TlpA family protein disulfide reductase [Bdellovibrionales bacterium]|nr:TlpA family protein disulfide reductase [Bdellovibrionales bacterium]